MAQHNQLGVDGEQIAVNHLIAQGYIIRHTNWRCGKLELDIIARRNQEVVFVEVKTRRNRDYAHPSDAIDEPKIRRMVTAADAYIRQYNIPFEVRFDVISVINDGHHVEIEHIEDAFLPPVWR